MQAPIAVRRAVYTAAYLAMTAAGICAWVWPSPSLASATGGQALLIAIWDAFLIVGGLVAGIGVATDRWIGEYVGLPLLAAVFSVYGVSALASGREPSRAVAATLIAVALFLVARWTDVGALRRAAVKGAAIRRGGT